MKSQRIILRSGAAIALALSCVACASAPDVPNRQLARAETSIEVAQENGAREHGPAALQRAQNELENAKVAAANEEYEIALELAERAELDAQLAMAQTNHQRAAFALHELQESIQALRREIARNQSS